MDEKYVREIYPCPSSTAGRPAQRRIVAEYDATQEFEPIFIMVEEYLPAIDAWRFVAAGEEIPEELRGDAKSALADFLAKLNNA